jgi:hypothetical protein
LNGTVAAITLTGVVPFVSFATTEYDTRPVFEVASGDQTGEAGVPVFSKRELVPLAVSICTMVQPCANVFTVVGGVPVQEAEIAKAKSPELEEGVGCVSRIQRVGAYADVAELRFVPAIKIIVKK